MIACAYSGLTQPLFSQNNAHSSYHFKLEKLKDGIYAPVHNSGGHAICNAGIIDLKNALWTRCSECDRSFEKIR